VRSVEWSGVSGVDSPGSVPGPPQRQRSQQCASCADVHYRVLVQWTPLFAIASESPQRHACSISCLEIPYLIVSPRTFLISRHFLWPPYVIGGGPLYSCPVISIYLLSFFLCSFFSSPNLSGRRLDVYHTLTHGVALVRIRGSLQMQDPKTSPKIAIWAPSHNFVGLYLCN